MSMQPNSLSLAHSCGGILSLLPRCCQALELIQFVLDVGRNFLIIVVDLLIGADRFRPCSTSSPWLICTNER